MSPTPDPAAQQTDESTASAGLFEAIASAEVGTNLESLLSNLDDCTLVPPDSNGAHAPQPATVRTASAAGTGRRSRVRTSAKSHFKHAAASLSKSTVVLSSGWIRSSAEILAVFAVIATCQIWLTGQLGAIDIQPHPYWVVVLPLAATRGLIAGLTASFCATVLYGIGLIQTGRASIWTELLDVHVMVEPILFFAASYLIGELRDRVTQANRILRADVDLLRAALQRRDDNLKLLQSANRELRRRLFDNPADFENVIHAVSNFASHEEHGVYEVPLRLAKERCGVTKCSVLLVLPDGAVDLARHQGWEPEEIRQRIEDANASVLVQRAITEAVPTHAFHARIPGVTDEVRASTTAGPLVVAPILDPTGVVTALLCLDDIPARRFQSTTVQTFATIAHWVASSLRQVGKGALPESLQATIREILRGDRMIGGPDELAGRMLVEDARSRRQGLPTSLLTLHATELEARIPGALDRMDRFLMTRVYPGLRLSDDVFRFGYPGYYVLVLTGTPRAGAKVVRERLLEKFAEHGTGGIGRIMIDLFSPGVDAVQLVEMLDDVARNYYDGHDLPDDFKCPIQAPARLRQGNAVDFASRLRVELGIALRFGQELSLVDFRSTDGSSDVGEMVARHLSNLPADVLRTADGIYVLTPQRCVVLLANTDCLSASKVWQRLQDQLAKTIPENRLHGIESDFLSLDGSESQLLMEYFLGDTATGDKAKELLSEEELGELEFSMDSLAGSESGFDDLQAGVFNEEEPTDRGPDAPFERPARTDSAWSFDMDEISTDRTGASPAVEVKLEPLDAWGDWKFGSQGTSAHRAPDSDPSTPEPDEPGATTDEGEAP